MYKKIQHLTTAAALGLLVWCGTGQVQAQTAEDGLRLGQRTSASGARMVGLGTAGYGGFGDVASIYGNPAGLGLVTRSSISGTLTTWRTEDAASSRTRGFSTSALDQTASSIGLSNVGWLYRAPTARGALVIGLAYNQVASFDRSMRFNGENSQSTISTSFLPFPGEYRLSEEGGLAELGDYVFPAFNGGLIEFFPEFRADDPETYPFLEAVIPGTTIRQGGTVNESGGLGEASLGGSLEVAEGMLVGVSLNLAFGRYDLRSTFEEEDIHDENGPNDYSVLQDDGSLLEGFDYLRFRQRVSSDLLGVNLRIGFSTKVTSSLRLGVSLETPTQINIDESYGTSYETHFDDGGILSYGDQSDDIGNGTYSYTLHTPSRIGAGASFELQRITVLLDVEVVDWSGMQFSSDDEGTFDDLNDQISQDYGTVVNMSGGMEVGFGPWQIRGGVSMRPDPFLNELSTSSGGSLNRDQLQFSAGFGFTFSENMQLNAAWSMGQFDGSYLPYPADTYGPRQEHIVHIDEAVTRQQVIAGMIYRF